MTEPTKEKHRKLFNKTQQDTAVMFSCFQQTLNDNNDNDEDNFVNDFDLSSDSD